MNELKVRRVSTFESFQALETEWDRLGTEARLDSIFLTHSWLCEWWRVYGANKTLCVLQVDAPTGTVALAPFAITRDRNGIRRLVFMGSGHILPGHLDILALPDYRRQVASAVWYFFWKHRHAWDLVDLTDLASDSPLRIVIEQAAPQARVRVAVRMSSLSPYAVLPDSFEAYVSSLGAATRKRLHYNRHRLLRAMPDVQFCRVRTVSELDSAFKALVRLHQARWTARGEPGSFARPGFKAFHTAAARAGLANGSLRMYYLRFANEIAAVLYCYRAGSRVCYYTSGFDERWTKYSVGAVLLAYVLEQSIAEGAREFDFLQGVEDYKRHWATGARENCRVLIGAPHLRGKLAWTREQSTSALRAWAKHILPRETVLRLRRLVQN